MNISVEGYDLLARLFSYPDGNFGETVQQVQQYLDENFPMSGKELRPFSEFVFHSSQTLLEELYLRTFDVQAVTTLDIGYLLFGDDYKRGKMLVHLNKEHQAAGNDCGKELADHLPNVLRLLPRMKDVQVRQELVEKILMPALCKMIAEFDPLNLQKKSTVYQKHHKTLLEKPAGFGVIYRHPLKAVSGVLKADFQLSQTVLDNSSHPQFSRSLAEELNIESDET